MVLRLCEASASDASRIADIHMAAFGSNVMLQAQFPTPAIRNELRKCIAKKAVADINDSETAVLVVRDDGDEEIISFAKWALPVSPAEEAYYTEPPWRWPEGTNRAILERWTGKVDAAQKKILGDAPCYHLSFIATDPQHEHRGAASLLIKWALESCKRDGVSAYLESTVDAGPFYERRGFEPTEKLSMVLEGVGEASTSVVYEEICFIFRGTPL